MLCDYCALETAEYVLIPTALHRRATLCLECASRYGCQPRNGWPDARQNEAAVAGRPEHINPDNGV